jgi:clorobiocin biosynthesis protein CloN4
MAYILYTSGSTGRPKGVCISHANALAFVDWAVAELDARPEDVFANHASLGFDLSVLDLYGAFAAGACVCLVPRGLERAPRELVALLVRERVSVWYSVPSALMLMMREGGLLDAPPPPRLRAVLFAGEPFPIAHVRRLAAWTDAPLLNLFGPTETNVCTFHRVRPEDLERDVPVPIGVACSGDTVHVLDEHGAPVPDGEEGELVVDGPTVMLGYHGRAPQRGPYRTGDVVRRRPDGTLDYAGRRDHQVKVRGNRVELGEVESAIAAHPDVEEVAVLVSGQAVEARLIAFVAGEQPPGTIAVKRACADRLPASMVVDAVQRLDRLPRTPNGKVDRAALLDRVRTRPAPAREEVAA